MDNDNRKENKLVLSHVFLYAKGWYQRTKEIWEGYLRCLIADGHYSPYSRSDVAYLLLKIIIKNKDLFFHGREDVDMYIHEQIRERIERLEWYEKDIEGLKPHQLYDTAVILFCHGVLQFTDKDMFSECFIPDKSVLPLRLNKDKKETVRQAEKRAKETFGKDAKPYEIGDEWYKSHFENLEKYHPLKDFIKEYNVEFIETVM